MARQSTVSKHVGRVVSTFAPAHPIGTMRVGIHTAWKCTYTLYYIYYKRAAVVENITLVTYTDLPNMYENIGLATYTNLPNTYAGLEDFRDKSREDGVINFLNSLSDDLQYTIEYPSEHGTLPYMDIGYPHPP